MTTQYQKIYLGRNNLFFVSPTYAGKALTVEEMQDITKIEIKYGSVFISSALYPALFDFTSYVADLKFWVNIEGLKLTAGRDEDCEIIIYSNAWPTFGRIAGPSLVLEATEDALGTAVLTDPLVNISLNDLYDVLATGGTTGYVLTQLADNTFAMAAPTGGSGSGRQAPLTVTDDYQILLTDLERTIRMNNALSKTATLPVVTAANDGARLTYIKQGNGDAVLACPAGVTIGDDSDIQVTGSSMLAAIIVEYNHAALAWIIIGGKGSWAGA